MLIYSLLLSYLYRLAPATTVDQFTSLASRAMCEVGGCIQKTCMESCLPKKLEYITGTEIRVANDNGGPIAINLVCHDTNSIAVSWCEIPTLIHLIKFTHAANVSTSRLNMTRSCSMVMTDLLPGSLYKVEVRRLGKFGQVGNTVFGEFSTISRDLQPGKVDSVTLNHVWEDDQDLHARISWTKSLDSPCQYGLVLWKNATTSHAEMLEVKFPEKLDEIVLTDLEFETNYRFGIMAVSQEQESGLTWLSFDVPPCQQFYPGNLTRCKPPPPSDVTVVDNLTGAGVCELQVAWEPPVDSPALYNLTAVKYDLSEMEEIETFTISVPGNLTEVTLPSLTPNTDVWITVAAVTAGGSSDQVTAHKLNICSHQYFAFLQAKSLNNIIPVRVAAGLSIFCFLLISAASLLLLYLKHRRKKNKQSQCAYYFKQQGLKKNPLNNKNNILRAAASGSDEYEIPADALLICDMIGEGAFGVVHKGFLNKSSGMSEPVAVKMLRENFTVEESRQFQKEIALMKTVGRHWNIVSLIGCCTQSCRLQLVVEFCALGDLQSYLRQEWRKLTEAITENSLTTGSMKYSDIATVNSFGSYTAPVPASVANVMYDFLTKRKINEKKTLAERLLSFSWQIAVGMEYLASNRVVHRDLAARNVLLCSDQCVKISDFGLSRDIYEQNIYCKRSSEKVPVKWMALESLLHQIYTTQSDVWSFGVLLWEIVTLGGNPYPSTPTNQMFQLLKQGFRMDQPPTCSNELFAIMRSCWKEKPHERPTFTALVGQLSDLLESSSPHQYLDLAHFGSYGGWGDGQS